MTPRISALVLTHNSAPQLEACLRSVAWTDEIVVMDDLSTDGTREIAAQFGTQWHTRKLETFSAQRNAALACCTGAWVVAVDADERLSPELCAEIQAALADPGDYAAFRYPRKNLFCGAWVRGCGWYPDYGVRLFRREGARYAGSVHEALHVDGPIGTLSAPVTHETVTSVAQYVDKMNHYSTLAARDLHDAGRRARVADVLLRPAWTFVHMYLLRGGARDGWAGLAVSRLSAYYAFLKYLKLAFLARGGS